MFYVSELINKRILDPNGNRVARVRDLIAELVVEPPGAPATPEGTGNADAEPEPQEREAPVITGIVARTGRKHQPFFLPIDQLSGIGPHDLRLRSLKVDLQPFERRPSEMLLARDLWDKQVIDLESRKVVRVNDILLSDAVGAPSDSGSVRLWVRGVDVGLGGLIRRLRLAGIMRNVARKALQPHVLPWKHLDVFGTSVQGGVHLPHHKLADLHPVEIARITDSVSYHQGAEIIASLDDTLAADTLEEIVAERQTDIVEYMPEERAADILEEMAPDEATDLLAELPEDKAGSLLNQMDEEEADEVRYLMRYPEHSAGGIMTTDFVRLRPDMTVQDVIDENRSTLLSADLIYYMYVIDPDQRDMLIGIVTVRDLLVYDRDKPVRDFMLKEFLSVRPAENQKEVARKMAEYNLLALPVVEHDGALVGVVTVDDALDALLPEGWQKRLPRIFS